MKCNFKLLAAAALIGACGLAHAASFTDAGYSQTFDSMGTTKVLPTDWTIWKVGDNHSTWTTSITANGANHSVAAMTSAGTSLVSAILDTSIIASTRNANGYNVAHSTTSSDRVLATSPTGIDGNAIQLSLTNGTGAAQSGIRISYDIDKFYDGNKQSSLDGNFPTAEELPGYQLFYSINNGTWYNVEALNPVRSVDGMHPVIAAGTPNSNGANGPVSFAVTSISNYQLTFASTWGAGQTLKLRWVDDNSVNLSPEQIIGLNNVGIAAVPEPETYAMLLAGLALLGFAGRRAPT